MMIPFHNNCREGWGCHPDCGVLALARANEDMFKRIEELERELEKKSQKKKTNE